VKLAPQSAEAHYQLGQLAMQQSRLKDAEAELSLSLNRILIGARRICIGSCVPKNGADRRCDEEFALYQDLKHAEEGGATSAMAPTGKP
jgi:hypothetical protein